MQHPFIVEDELRRAYAQRLAEAQRDAWFRAASPKPLDWRRRLARLLLHVAVRLDDALAQAQAPTLPSPGCADRGSQRADPLQR